MRVGHGRGGGIGRGWPCGGGSALWRRRGRAERGTAAAATCDGADRHPGPISCGVRDGAAARRDLTRGSARAGERVGFREGERTLGGGGASGISRGGAHARESEWDFVRGSARSGEGE